MLFDMFVEAIFYVLMFGATTYGYGRLANGWSEQRPWQGALILVSGLACGSLMYWLAFRGLDGEPFARFLVTRLPALLLCYPLGILGIRTRIGRQRSEVAGGS